MCIALIYAELPHSYIVIQPDTSTVLLYQIFCFIAMIACIRSMHSCFRLGSRSTPGPANPRTWGINTTIFWISSMIIAVAVFFMIGFLCGCLCYKYMYKQSLIMKVGVSESRPPLSHTAECQRVQELELTENVAYGPLPATVAN